MRRLLVLGLIGLACLEVAGQTLLEGHLLDSTTNEPVQFAHVRNIEQAVGSLTDRSGHFRIFAELSDTLVFSIVGYQTLAWVIEEKHLNDEPYVFKLPRDTILLKEVTVTELPTEAEFKRRILATEVKDTAFWYHGVAAPVFRGNKLLDEKYVKNPLFLLAHPITGWHYRFSKKEKEKRKMHKINQQSLVRTRVDLKFKREWVREVTSLQGDELTNFISFCNYDLDYLDRTPLYLIREDMLVKLEEFQLLAKQ